MTDQLNDTVATRLDEAATLLASQGANPFRVRAYRHAAATLRQLPEPVSRVLEAQGLEGLERLPDRGERHYTALFSNTAQAHRTGKTGDWVVIYRDHGAVDGQWTVVTGPSSPWHGRRIVRGREAECMRHYVLEAA